LEGSCEYSNEILGFIKSGELLDKLKDALLLKKGSPPYSIMS
jgi:hypothetical protein